MLPRTILIVDDNPITRKLVRATLESAGYAVLDAQDGRTAVELMASHSPDLVLQDLLLPDLAGSELVKRLRAVARGAEVPILAVSGFLAKVEQDRILQQGFSDILRKPVEPSRLLQVIRAYLPPTVGRPEQPVEGRQVLVAHDDPVQLKLLKIHLEQLGFRVTTTTDGAEALDQARRSRPDAIVSDVLMPRLDGFRLCQKVREDPDLAHVPVILTSAEYTEEADRRLAQMVGVSAFVVSTPDFRDVVEALLASLAETAPPQPASPAELLAEHYTERVVRQLERQAGLRVDVAQRLTSLEAELAILASLAQILEKTAAIDLVLNELLQRCVDAVGVSRGAAYLLGPDGRLTLGAQFDYSAADEPLLRELFGHADVFRHVMAAGEAVALPSAKAGLDGTGDLLVRARARSMLIAPLVLGDERLGVFMMASEDRNLGEDWLAFVKVVGSQIGQAIGLARALSQLRWNEERLAFLAEASSVLVGSLDYETTLTNLAHLAVPFLADWCVVDVATEDQSIRRLAMAQADPTREEWARRLDRDYAADPNAPYGVAQVLRTGQSEFEPDLPAALGVARHARHLEILRQAGVTSAMIVPLVARGRTLAALTVGMAESGRRYGPADLALAEELARRAALAVDNARLYRAAQEAVRARDEFLSVAAHELRTPMTSLRGFAQVIVRQIDRQIVLEPLRVRRSLQEIDLQSTKLSQLVDQLLDVSRIEAGKLRLDRHVVDVTSLVAGVVAAAQTKTSRHSLVVQAPTAVSALVDPLRLEQVVTNLVDNAIKFSPEGGPIDVEVSAPDAETVRLAVRDRGIGIPPERRQYIFDRFYQAHAGGLLGGMGLGLYISCQIVRLHRGEIAAEFPPDGGTRFVVSLPRSSGAATSLEGPAAA